ncbi:MAG: hypothetical protein JXK95_15630 [Bacteroidales bacterium]|nr:hypothetical protein [Bacteroidales bacterium]
MIVYKSPTVTIEYDKEKCQIIQKWKGFSSSDVFRTAIMKTTEFARANLVKSLISDTREQSVVKGEDIEFAASRMPKVAFGNIKAMAFIMPKNIFAEMSVKKFEKESNLNMIRYFDSYETAQAWIDTVVK